MSAPITKPSSEWTEEDILALIYNVVKESTELDYKESRDLEKTDSKKRAISKDVSALANAAGGILVYGMREDGKIPIAIDEGSDSSEITKEWLEDVITSNIRPRITGIAINRIELGGENEGRVLYVVSVPQSFIGAPHQAADKKYYRRFNFKSEPMEDYEIRDIMKRSLGPDLYSEIRIGERDDIEAFPATRHCSIQTRLGNQSSEAALYALVDLFFDEELAYQNDQPLECDLRRGVRCVIDGIEKTMNQMRFSWVVPQVAPLFKGTDQNLTERPLTFIRTEYIHEFAMAVILNSPQMSPKSLVVILRPSEIQPGARVEIRENATFEVISP